MSKTIMGNQDKVNLKGKLSYCGPSSYNAGLQDRYLILTGSGAAAIINNDILNDVANLKSRVTTLETDNTQLKREVISQTAEIVSLQERVQFLENADSSGGGVNAGVAGGLLELYRKSGSDDPDQIPLVSKDNVEYQAMFIISKGHNDTLTQDSFNIYELNKIKNGASISIGTNSYKYEKDVITNQVVLTRLTSPSYESIELVVGIILVPED